MKIGHFVSASAVVLTGWLGLTFVHEVPAQRYPKQSRQTVSKPELPSAATSKADPEVFQVSVSH